MAVFKFGENDVFVNTLEAYPETSFYIHSGNVVIDSIPDLSGSNQSNILHVADGHISLYEINVDRPEGQEISASITADGVRSYPSALSISGINNYNVLYQPGQEISVSYNLSGTISQYYYPASIIAPAQSYIDVGPDKIQNSNVAIDNGRVIHGYRNSTYEESTNNSTQLGHPVPFSIEGILDKYSFLSPHFKMKTSAPLPERDLRTVEISVISIPSIFYGSKIKKGSVELNYYVSGSKIGTLTDRGMRGELIQTGPEGSTGSGSVAGLVFYQEGILILTGSWQLGNNNSIDYSGSGGTLNKWTHFGSGLHKDNNTSANLHSASFAIDFQGTTRIPTMTMLCKAPYSELNWSNNPTFVDQNSSYFGTFNSSSYHYIENEVSVKNITHTELVDYTPEQIKETYISKVAIYDEKKNLIGVAKVANPVRKTPDRSYLFKLKLDL